MVTLAVRHLPLTACVRSFEEVQGEIVLPPPPSPPFWPESIFKGEGGGVYISNPPAAGILYPPPPLFYTPPTPRRVFSWVRGWGCIKFGPVKGLAGGGTGSPKVCSPAHKGGIGKRVQEKRPESTVWDKSPCANPLCPPTPFFEASECEGICMWQVWHVWLSVPAARLRHE